MFIRVHQVVELLLDRAHVRPADLHARRHLAHRRGDVRVVMLHLDRGHAGIDQGVPDGDARVGVRPGVDHQAATELAKYVQLATGAALPIKSVADLKGMKVRGPTRQITKMLGYLGATPVGMPLPAIPDALSKGTIDGAEWVGPYDDEKLGFNKVAGYYYYPGWWEGGPLSMTLVNEKKWNELPKHYQAALQLVTSFAHHLALVSNELMISQTSAEPPTVIAATPPHSRPSGNSSRSGNVSLRAAGAFMSISASTTRSRRWPTRRSPSWSRRVSASGCALVSTWNSALE